MSKENEQVFRHCDSFVVLSGDEQKKQEWLEFGQNLGLECLGCLDSKLKGEEEIYSRKPFLQGKIVGLERGKIIERSPIIRAMVSDIVQKSKYGEKTEEQIKNNEGIMIDDTELGFELGYGKQIFTEDGIAIKKVRWPENSLSQIYRSISEKVSSDQAVKINGVRANFILCGICKAAKQNGVKDISAYDIRTKSYIPIRNLPKKKGLKNAKGLSYNIIRNKENVFMDIDITKEQYSLKDYEQCVLPQIKKGENLYLSGRMPLWLLASIGNSYNSNKMFTFQPGKGFTCISSTDEKDLGTIVDGVNGIDINQYFEDKKEKSKMKSLEVIEKRGILSKIRGWFVNFRENKEKTKYLDDTIKAAEVSQFDRSSTTKESFQDDLKEGIPKPLKEIEQSLYNQKEMLNMDIGG